MIDTKKEKKDDEDLFLGSEREDFGKKSQTKRRLVIIILKGLLHS